MELNAEINKVFGEEMAKIFAQKISEEELVRLARFSFEGMLKDKRDSWGHLEREAELPALIRNVLVDRTNEFIKKELEKPENEELLQERAKRIVANARKIAEEEITARIASSIYNNAIRVDYSDYEDGQLMKNLMERMSKLEQEHGHY
jgi:hypothetical protein